MCRLLLLLLLHDLYFIFLNFSWFYYHVRFCICICIFRTDVFFVGFYLFIYLFITESYTKYRHAYGLHSLHKTGHRTEMIKKLIQIFKTSTNTNWI